MARSRAIFLPFATLRDRPWSIIVKTLENKMHDLAKNVLGGVLQPCSTDPMTGFFRTGDCQVTEEDIGNHGVCIIASAEFLAFLEVARQRFVHPASRV